MTTFIYKTNQYLIERYPTVWNTKLVWMLGSSLCLHLLFFIFGLMTLTDPETLQKRGVDDIFFENGMVFLSIIISVLLLVVWLIYLFKNNAFKSFYPITRAKLFLQFIYYVIIIFCCSTFYLSYNYGMKAYIASTYSNTQIAKEINIVNNAAVFLSENIQDYTLDKRRYPQNFSELFCETNEQQIDNSQPYLSFLGEDYQFYSLKTLETPVNNIYRNQEYGGYIYSKTNDSIRTYYFKDSVVAPPLTIKSAAPSYYNYSSTFYLSKNDTLTADFYDYNYDNYKQNYSYEDYSYDYDRQSSLRNKSRSQQVVSLLKRNDKQEIQQMLSYFIATADTYRVKHNLSTEAWFKLVYHPTDFEIKSFIRDQEPVQFEYSSSIAVLDTKFQQFVNDNTTTYFLENDKLRNVFENIENIKANNPLMESIHFFMWFSFFLAMIIFTFRVTGLKPLLFGIVTVGVLTLLITLITALIFYISYSNDDTVGYFIAYFVVLLGAIILAIPLFFYENIKKLIVAICLNISMNGFVLYIFLILGIIAMHQRDHCDNTYTYGRYEECVTIFDYLDMNWSFVLFFVGLVFMYFYMSVIKKWKSLPEG